MCGHVFFLIVHVTTSGVEFTYLSVKLVVFMHKKCVYPMKSQVEDEVIQLFWHVLILVYFAHITL